METQFGITRTSLFSGMCVLRRHSRKKRFWEYFYMRPCRTWATCPVATWREAFFEAAGSRFLARACALVQAVQSVAGTSVLPSLRPRWAMPSTFPRRRVRALNAGTLCSRLKVEERLLNGRKTCRQVSCRQLVTDGNCRNELWILLFRKKKKSSCTVFLIVRSSRVWRARLVVKAFCAKRLDHPTDCAIVVLLGSRAWDAVGVAIVGRSW